MSDKPNTSVVMCTTADGMTKVEATFDNDTVWLSIDQMAELFTGNYSKTAERSVTNRQWEKMPISLEICLLS